MGVMASYCQLCDLPVHHDHYYTLGEHLGIYRGEGRVPARSKAKLGPEHAWLKDAVGVRVDEDQEPAVIEGPVHDGAFDADDEFSLVSEGCEDRAALHRYCHQALGRPVIWDDHGWDPIDPKLRAYKKQLFDFARFQGSPLAWMLIDPRKKTGDGERSRKRIAARVKTFLSRDRKVPASVRHQPHLANLLRFLEECGATSFELIPDSKPIFARDGRSIPSPFPVIGGEDCYELVFTGLDTDQRLELLEKGTFEAEIAAPGARPVRVRVSARLDDRKRASATFSTVPASVSSEIARSNRPPDGLEAILSSLTDRERAALEKAFGTQPSPEAQSKPRNAKKKKAPSGRIRKKR